MLRDGAFLVIALTLVIALLSRRERRRGRAGTAAVRLRGLRALLVGAALAPIAAETSGWGRLLWVPVVALVVLAAAQLLVPDSPRLARR